MNVSPITHQRTVKRMSLANVVVGPVHKPPRVVVYGIDGVGKSTFAAGAPKPIFCGAEDGTNQMNVTRFPTPQRFQDVRDAVDELIAETHDFETFVLDTVDWAEPLIWREVCAEGNKKSIEDFGFGKGYLAALEKLEGFLTQLNTLRDVKRMNVIILAHSEIKTFKNPEADDYDRYQLKLRDKSAAKLREWSDCTLFANYETLVAESGGRTKGVSTGARYLYTNRRSGFDAKNRYVLPDRINLSWDAFIAGVRAADPVALRARAEELLPLVPESTREAATKFLGECGNDVNSLSAAIGRLEDLAKGDKK